MSSGHLHPQYNLRWPEELRDKIAESAKAHNRSMNADIVARLEESFNNHGFNILTLKEPTNDKERFYQHMSKQLFYMNFYLEQLDTKIGKFKYMIKLLHQKPEQNEVIDGISNLTRYKVLLESTAIEREATYQQWLNACKFLNVDSSSIEEQDAAQLITEFEEYLSKSL